MGRSRPPKHRELPPPPDALPAPVVDSHTHLDSTFEETGLEVADALQRAAAVGVTHLIQVGCDVDSSRWAAEQASAHDRIWATVALHPNEAPRSSARGALEADLAAIDRLAALPQVRGVGETGLDYFRTGEEGRPLQAQSFRSHIEMAGRHGKALVIHDRDAHADVLAVLADAGPPDRVVFHCFSGDAAMAAECASHGWFVSFAGVVTFRNGSALRAALAEVPPELLLVETDAPYLTPEPYRGRPNASFLLPHTVAVMAQVKGLELADMCGHLWRNADRAFGPL